MNPRVVFDCVVFLQAAARPDGPAGACLRALDAGDLTLYISSEILLEVRDVLQRPKLRQRFPTLPPGNVDNILQNIQSKSLLIAFVPPVCSLPRDPKDEPYLNLAIAAQASYLVTRDRDLLDLMADTGFRQRFPDLQILEPPEFLRALKVAR